MAFEGLKALVTGGAGFIESHIVDGLIGMGCEVLVIDNMLTGRLENIKHLVDNRLFHFVKGDVRDMDYLRQ